MNTSTIPGLSESQLGPAVHSKRQAHVGRWIAAAFLTLVAAQIIYELATNRRLNWEIIGQYLFSKEILSGLWMTIVLTVLAMVIGMFLGLLVAVMRLSNNPILSAAGRFYIWFFRGTPLLVQILFWAYASAVFPTIGIGLPFGGPEFFSTDINKVIPIFVAGLLALGLNEAAYVAEIVRAGVLSVGRGQIEAGHALGMTNARIMRRIILPQAMRIIVPPLGNATISMLKTTSLVYTIAIPELLTSAKIIYGSNFQQIPLLIVVSIWYLALTTVLSLVQSRIERRYGRGVVRTNRKRTTVKDVENHDTINRQS